MTPANDATAKAPPLKLSRVLRARRDTVFRAWSSAEQVTRWFAPEGCTVDEATVEMRVGGRFELSMRAPNGEANWLRGTFVEIVPDTRLVIDMRIDDSAGAPLFRAYTELDFADAPGGTRLDVTQTYTLIDLSKAWMLAGAPQGWNSTLDNLEREVVHLEG
ncbi:MAG TPA: SRPBCC domain-containing protein [Stellaceae bacterium]|nr:SRPBCC domain-containing protein [Stellaceae bacterium]